MHNALDRHNTLLTLAALEPLRETAPAARRGECPFMARVSRAFGGLRPRLAQALERRRKRFRGAAIDDHTLNDIGLSRMEAADWGPAPRRNGRPVVVVPFRAGR
jgi:uncharacterized protein YjiS (DUF1127 family)